ncbi:MAG: hypothetical protein Q4P30_05540 [Eubacteriales bacterium]|nr:hypothetical protein [Eubacteriales bacterium]
MKKAVIIIVVLLLIAAGIYFIVKPFGVAPEKSIDTVMHKMFEITTEEAKQVDLTDIKPTYDRKNLAKSFTDAGYKQALEDQLMLEAVSLVERENKSSVISSLDIRPEKQDERYDVTMQLTLGEKVVDRQFKIVFKKDGLKRKIDQINPVR